MGSSQVSLLVAGASPQGARVPCHARAPAVADFSRCAHVAAASIPHPRNYLCEVHLGEIGALQQRVEACKRIFVPPRQVMGGQTNDASTSSPLNMGMCMVRASEALPALVMTHSERRTMPPPAAHSGREGAAPAEGRVNTSHQRPHALGTTIDHSPASRGTA